MEQITQKTKKQYKYKRVYLNDGADRKLSSLLTQVNEHFSGMVKLNKNDLANTIICEYPNKFSKKQLDHLQREFLTDLQKAKWIVLQMEKAKKEGIDVNFESLITKTQNIKYNKKRHKNKSSTTPEKK